ncbi:acetyl-CoA acetyltransferase [Nocardioides aromaticivorans]|uniref:Acetyl-CoA acetyltransferase n=1 Tax=Nocardioides aromaticivorans TaxID=200618 RepID=A0ABX7PIH3_9ACTN|nr:acetyl-CoA C-acyltransferase [Nocardioides aromaticivorans]QSR25746.1 acetyl-CoA acetyltransferase [Nocardioides aromaticivorans]
MSAAVIVDAVRTPLAKGKPGGAYADIHPVDLHAAALRALVDRTGIDPVVIDDVISGAVGQVGEQAGNTARWALLAAGYPESVPGVTVDRQCGSSQQALHFAAQGVIAGAYDVAVASGVESMSRIPIGSQFQGKDFFGPQVGARYGGGLVPQGISAELIAQKWDLSRAQLDEYSAMSHERAARAWKDGLLDSQVTFVNDLRTDETIRPGTSVETLAGLRPAFRNDDWAAAYPTIDWRVTAGNSSPVNDGSAAVLVTSDEAAARLGLKPRARVHSFAVVGDDPILMLTGIIPATKKVLDRAGLSLGDIDAFEVNEAFASVVLAWQAETGADLAKVNVNGGAIAIGHPLGASGARLATSLLNVLEQQDGRFGLQVMCEAGGLANATIIERI